MDNLLLKEVEFKITETKQGTWREFLYPNTKVFREYTSHRKVLGLPFFQYKMGRNPETGRVEAARGFIAIGQLATGYIAIGQLCWGWVAIGQAAFGKFAAIGQLALAPFAIGQFTLALAAIAQIGIAYHGLFQIGLVLST